MRGYRPYKGMRRKNQIKLALLIIAAALLAYLSASFITGGVVRRVFEQATSAVSFKKAAQAPQTPAAPEVQRQPEQKADQQEAAQMLSVYIPAAKLATEDADSLAQQLRSKGIGFAAIEFKDETGSILFDAPQSKAIVPEAVQQQIGSEALQKFKAAGIKTAAVISLFKDDTAPRSYGDCATKLSGGMLWLDRNEKRWIDPYTEAAKTYLGAVVSDAAGLGFDEIIFRDCGFPTEGKINLINYADGGVSKSDRVTDFVKYLSERAQGLKTSVLQPEKALTNAEYAAAAGISFEGSALPKIPLLQNVLPDDVYSMVPSLKDNFTALETAGLNAQQINSLVAALKEQGIKAFMFVDASGSYDLDTIKSAVTG